MKLISNPDEFYVGYISPMPSGTLALMKRITIALTAFMILICLALIFSQHKFSSSNFEYGIPTRLEGVVFKTPVPYMRINLVPSQNGQPLSKTILLVGYGKSGALTALEKFEKEQNISLEGQHMSLNGYLIYGDGKTVFQVIDDGNRLLSSSTADDMPGIKDLGELLVQGEIVDPKCYFGVMKPGEGKAHRSCAIRCISGGIPPVLHALGSSDYFVVLDENYQPVNQEVVDMVGDRVTLNGKVTQLDDWRFLLVDRKNLKKQASSSKLRQTLMAMELGMTQCGTN